MKVDTLGTVAMEPKIPLGAAAVDTAIITMPVGAAHRATPSAVALGRRTAPSKLSQCSGPILLPLRKVLNNSNNNPPWGALTTTT